MFPPRVRLPPNGRVRDSRPLRTTDTATYGYESATNAPPSSPEDVLNALLCFARAGFNRRAVPALLSLSGAWRCRQRAVGRPGRCAAELSGLVQVVALLGLQQRSAALVGQVLRRSQLTQQHCGRHRLQQAHSACHQTNGQRDAVQPYEFIYAYEILPVLLVLFIIITYKEHYGTDKSIGK